MRKNSSRDREINFKFEAEGREFANFMRSLDEFIRTLKGPYNFLTCSWRFLRSNTLEQFKLEKIIGIHKLTGKIRKRDFLEIINLYTRYKYGREKSDLKIEIGVQEKKLYLELGPSFNYKKEHKLFISLHSESYEIINLKFNVLPEAVEAP